MLDQDQGKKEHRTGDPKLNDFSCFLTNVR